MNKRIQETNPIDQSKIKGIFSQINDRNLDIGIDISMTTLNIYARLLLSMPYSYELTEHAKMRLEERSIPLEWIERTLFNPQKVEPDKKDPELLCALAAIPEFDHRVLRVVYKPTENSYKIITFHFDRSMRGKL
jgi:Domain of unknown function (DUF4258)